MNNWLNKGLWNKYEKSLKKYKKKILNLVKIIQIQWDKWRDEWLMQKGKGIRKSDILTMKRCHTELTRGMGK